VNKEFYCTNSKGDAQGCKNYRVIKLMSHSMKIRENIIKKRIRSEASASENQFGFLPEKLIIEPLFCVRQLVEKYRERNKKLCMVFIDLEKVNDRVRKMYINFIQGMYESPTSFKTQEYVWNNRRF